VQFLDFGGTGDAQLGIEIGERSSNRNTWGSRTMAAAHGDALALSAGPMPGITVEQRRQRDFPRRG